MLCVITLSVYAQDLTANQQKLRSEIMSFLQEEGYVPELDTDGEIMFKKEGTKYYIGIDNRDESPMYLRISLSFLYDDTYTREKVERALPELNRYKGVKTLCFDESYSYRAEVYLVDAEHFKFIFYKLMDQLDSMRKELKKICSGSSLNAHNTPNVRKEENLLRDPSLWQCMTSSKTSISFRKNKMYVKDLANYGYGSAFYRLSENLRNLDFQLEYQIKAKFAMKHASLCLAMGSTPFVCHTFDMSEWGDNILTVSAGTYEKRQKYSSYTKLTNATSSGMNTFLIKKTGKNVLWSCNGYEIFSKKIDADIDITLLGFLIGNKHEIEVSKMDLKLL